MHNIVQFNDVGVSKLTQYSNFAKGSARNTLVLYLQANPLLVKQFERRCDVQVKCGIV